MCFWLPCLMFLWYLHHVSNDTTFLIFQVFASNHEFALLYERRFFMSLRHCSLHCYFTIVTTCLREFLASPQTDVVHWKENILGWSQVYSINCEPHIASLASSEPFLTLSCCSSASAMAQAGHVCAHVVNYTESCTSLSLHQLIKHCMCWHTFPTETCLFIVSGLNLCVCIHCVYVW